MTAAIDPDFARLLKGDIKLADLEPVRQEEFKVWVMGQKLGFESIKEDSTREMITRWASYFK
jgi:hypothetical protein